MGYTFFSYLLYLTLNSALIECNNDVISTFREQYHLILEIEPYYFSKILAI